jgi:CRISPR-associated protein Csb1
MSDAAPFDAWLNTDAFAALVIREHLTPVEGPDGVVFPATYAAAEDKKVFPGGYNIDPPEGDKNVCLVDSVGSQANRIEAIFAKPDYAKLVPQVTVRAGEKSVSLLEAGHRAGDALVRCTALQKDLQDAFKAVLRGNAEPMAKIAPTSLVFGVWDSRDTQAKLPRLIASTIRAFDVRRLRRSAQFNPATEYITDKLLEETTDKATKDAYAERGFVHVPATGSHGGVIATGGIRRDATLSFAALRLLAAGADEKKTLALRRYVLGLSLVAFTTNASTYLRQGCNLVPNVEKPREFTLVHSDGTREAAKLTHADALKFALAAAKEFKVGEDRTVEFDKNLAKKDVAGEGDTKATRNAEAKKAAAAAKKAAKAVVDTSAVSALPAGE